MKMVIKKMVIKKMVYQNQCDHQFMEKEENKPEHLALQAASVGYMFSFPRHSPNLNGLHLSVAESK